MGRTDARAMEGMDEAIARCIAFREADADITFLEAPLTTDEMKRYCNEVTGPKMANMIEHGKTPVLSPAELESMGYSMGSQE